MINAGLKEEKALWRTLAAKHAGGAQGLPTISFTTKLEVAKEFAGESGVVIKTMLPMRDVVDIPKLSGEIHVNLPLGQIIHEQEYVYFGILPKDKFEIIE